MKVKDQSGTVVRGIERTPGGGLIVNDQSSYHKYMYEKERASRVVELETQVAQLTELVQKLLEKNNG
ncbi:MAG: hypothetical protein ACYDG4_17050 [Desulfuromonadaceae bacterium]|jgi:hypothetical protein